MVSKEEIVLVETVDAAVMLWFRMEVEFSWEKDTASGARRDNERRSDS